MIILGVDISAMFDEKDNSRQVSVFDIGPAPGEAVVEAGSTLGVAFHDVGTSLKEQRETLNTRAAALADYRKWR